MASATRAVSDLLRRSGHLLLFVLTHYGHAWAVPLPTKPSADGFYLDYVMGTFWFSLAAWQAVVWAMALALLWLDRQPPAAMAPWRKLHVPFSNVREPTFREMLPVVLRNQAILTAAGYLAFLWVPLRPPANVSLLGTAFGFIKHLATADVLLTVGHWAMHAPRFQYLRKSHHLHHSSWAIVSISGYYMSVLDAFLEHFTITISFLLWGELGGFMPTAFTVGAFNVLVTHSGWDIWFLPDPKKHYLHHAKYTVNYGLFLDPLIGTNMEWDEKEMGHFFTGTGATGATTVTEAVEGKKAT